MSIICSSKYEVCFLKLEVVAADAMSPGTVTYFNVQQFFG